MAGRLAVVGAGLMGSGIAQVAAQAGWQVTLRDLDDKATTRGRAGIENSLAKFAAKGAISQADAEAAFGPDRDRRPTWTRLPRPTSWSRPSSSRSRSSRRCSAPLDKVCKPGALLATNTSAIPITQIAAVTERPEWVVGTHFFSPVPMMKLCELVRGLQDFRRGAARRPGLRRGDRQDLHRGQPRHRRLRHHPADLRPGGGGGEARRVRRGERGGPRPRLQVGLRARDGPAGHHRPDRGRLLTHAARNIYAETADPKFFPPELLQRMVAAGDLGRKSGKGFYDYE